MLVKKALLNELGKEQKKDGELSKEDLKRVAKKTCLPEKDVYSAATFYSFLSTDKRADHIIQVCNCPASHLHGSEKLLRHLETRLKVKRGNATKGKKIFLTQTSCIGLCDKAPAIMVDGKPYSKMTREKIDKLLEKLK